MTPRQALGGKYRHNWVAKQMRVSDSQLSRLLSGERTWTDQYKRTFAGAVGLEPTAIDFALEPTKTAGVLAPAIRGGAAQRSHRLLGEDAQEVADVAAGRGGDTGARNGQPTAACDNTLTRTSAKGNGNADSHAGRGHAAARVAPGTTVGKG